MKIKCIIDKVSYKSKPQGKDGGIITNRMTLDTAKEYSIEQIKENILNGKTIRPSYCGGKQETWKSQQMFMIDIDNEANLSDGIILNDFVQLIEGKKNKVKFLVGSEQHKSYNDIINHCQEINLIPNFIYTSFNHKEEQHKIRLVYILDKEITDYNIARKIQLYLMRSIGDVDANTCNINRFYYAGKKIVFDSGNILDSDNIIKLSKDIEINSKVSSNKSKSAGPRKRVLYNNDIFFLPILSSTPKLFTSESDNNYTIKAIANRNIEYLKSKYGNGEKKIFETKQQFLDYIRKEINLGEFLEFHYPKSIRCIFHNDHNPSAGIFQSSDDGAWIYNCLGCGVSYNIIGVIERLAGFKSRPKTYKFIKQIFNLEIMDTEWQKSQKEMLQENIDILYDDFNFKNTCPQTNKNINRIKHYLDRLIHIAMKNIYNKELADENGQVVFFASGDYICKEIGLSSNSLNKVYQKLAVFTYHKLLNKLSDKEVPERLKKRAQAIIINHNTTDNNLIRHVNFFSIPSYSVNRFPEIEKRARQWKENHYTMKGVSREMFYRAEGLEIANEIYPQYKKITETIDGKNHIFDRTTTTFSDERTINIVIAINELIEEYGYATEKDIVQKLKFKYRYTTTEVQIKRSLKEILEGYGLQRIRAKKKIKEQFGVVSNGYPFIIIKND